MKVYIVTSGDYSYYGIDAVFLTKEKAELYINAHKHDAYYDEDYYNIEEYDTFDDNIYEEKDKKVITLKYECDYGLEHHNVEITNLPLINNSNKIIEGISIHTDYYDCRKINTLKLVKIINSDRVKTKEQYQKILQDIVAETQNMLFEYDYVIDSIDEVITSIEEALKHKYL